MRQVETREKIAGLFDDIGMNRLMEEGAKFIGGFLTASKGMEDYGPMIAMLRGLGMNLQTLHVRV